MTCIINNKSKRRLSAKLVAGLAISAFLVAGTFTVSANAEGHHGGRGHVAERARGGGHRGGYGGGYGGGYVAPPVVYGSPYGNAYYGTPYYPPPVVYGPGIGIALPGVGISIF